VARRCALIALAAALAWPGAARAERRNPLEPQPTLIGRARRARRLSAAPLIALAAADGARALLAGGALRFFVTEDVALAVSGGAVVDDWRPRGAGERLRWTIAPELLYTPFGRAHPICAGPWCVRVDLHFAAGAQAQQLEAAGRDRTALGPSLGGGLTVWLGAQFLWLGLDYRAAALGPYHHFASLALGLRYPWFSR
jgi:hypothetical protein